MAKKKEVKISLKGSTITIHCDAGINVILEVKSRFPGAKIISIKEYDNPPKTELHIRGLRQDDKHNKKRK
jgi:hypothetical protein